MKKMKVGQLPIEGDVSVFVQVPVSKNIYFLAESGRKDEWMFWLVCKHTPDAGDPVYIPLDAEVYLLTERELQRHADHPTFHDWRIV